MELMLRRRIDAGYIKIFAEIYKNNETSITLNGMELGNIQIQKGVKQGASTSPILFNLIMDELLRTIRNERMGYVLGDIWVGAFAFADDLLLISVTETEMNKMLTEVSN